MAKFNYGNAIERYPLQDGETIHFEDQAGSLKVHDIYNPLPDFMKEADLVITDLPYNTQMINGYYTKADIVGEPKKKFDSFLLMLFNQIDVINPHTVLIEIGKQNIRKVEAAVRERYDSVQVIESTYHKKNLCYFVRGSNINSAPMDYNGLDEIDVIHLACEKESYTCVADPLMGQGEVAVSAHENNKKFVGTELNKKRLAVTIERIVKQGGKLEKGASTQ